MGPPVFCFHRARRLRESTVMDVTVGVGLGHVFQPRQESAQVSELRSQSVCPQGCGALGFRSWTGGCDARLP